MIGHVDLVRAFVELDPDHAPGRFLDGRVREHDACVQVLAGLHPHLVAVGTHHIADQLGEQLHERFAHQLFLLKVGHCFRSRRTIPFTRKLRQE